MLGRAAQQAMLTVGPCPYIEFPLWRLQHAVAYLSQRAFVALLPSWSQGKARMEFSLRDAWSVLPYRMLSLVQQRILESVR
eukprot:5426442-Amphidinium_carterae.1